MKKSFITVVTGVLCSVVIGISPAAADGATDADEPIVDETPADKDEAKELFSNHFVSAREGLIIGIDQFGMEHSRTRVTTFYQGRYQEPLEGEDFYRTVQQPDLADDYRSNNHIRRGLLFGGAAGVVAGPLIVLSTIMGGSDPVADDDDFDETPLGLGTRFWVGLGATTVGSIALMAGNVYDPHPVEAHERRQMAEEFNFRLIDELELDEDDLPDEDDDEGLRVENMQFDFFVDDGPRGEDRRGGLTLGGQF